MEELIKLSKFNEIDVVDSITLASELDIQHKNLISSITSYFSTIEDHFGPIAFETRLNDNGGKATRIAYLTEDQSLFVTTLSRNSDQVVSLKAKLVKSFQAARRLLDQARSFTLPTTFSEALRLAAAQAEQIEKQEAEIKILEPKGEFYDAVVGSDDTVDIGTVAKVLNFKGVGRTKLFQILRDSKILMENNRPYQSYVDREWFRVIETTYSKPDGSQHIYFKTVVFQKGIEGIRKILNKQP